MARSKFANLKGIRLYNALVKELGEQNKKKPKKQPLSLRQRKEIVSKQLYPKFKGGKFKVAELRKDINGIINALPPVEICNPLYLSEAFLSFVEYYDIDNHIRRVLPECLDIRVNAGQFGKTKIFNTSNYSYYGDGVQRVIESIRKKFTDKSGRAYFNGIIKVKPNKKDDGNGENYFVDYVLYINDEPEADEEGTIYRLPTKEDAKYDKVQDFIAVKVNTLLKEKRRKRRAAKREAERKKAQEPQEVKKRTNQAIKDAIKSLRTLLKNNVITRKEYDIRRRDLLSRIVK